MPSVPTGLRATYKSNPITSFAGFDSVYDINAALSQYENGYFGQAARLADNMGRDDRIDGVLRSRVDALLGTDLDVLPADERKKSQKFADMLGGVEDTPGRWDEIFGPGSLSEVLRTGIELNFAVSEIQWYVEDGIAWPRLKFWHSQFVRWDWYSESYKLITADRGEIDLPNISETTIGEGKWFIWCPFGHRYAWRRGLVRSLAPMFMRRMWNNRDLSRFLEVHGNPGKIARVPGGSDSTVANQNFFDAVANMNAEPTVLAPDGGEGKKYDVELLEATARTYQGFFEAKTDVNTDIAVLILGQPDTTEAPTGLGQNSAKGSRTVQLDRAKNDAALAVAIRNQILKPWAKINFGDYELAPRPIWRVEPAEDLSSKATTLKMLGDACTSMTAGKLPVNPRELGEEFGVPMISEEEQAANEAVAAEEAQAQLDAMAEAGGNQLGGAPGADGKKPAPKPRPATFGPSAIDAIMALANSGSWGGGLVTLKARGPQGPRGKKLKPDYPEAVTQKALKLAARLLAPDVRAIIGEVQASTSFADAEKKIVAYYSDKMDSEALAQLVAKVRLMGNLSGRLSVQRER